VKDRVLVVFDADGRERAAIERILSSQAEVDYIRDLEDNSRRTAIRLAAAVLMGNVRSELKSEEFDQLECARFIQILPAGANRVPFERIRSDIIIASNVGAYAEPMAEHVVAMVLALAKNLVLQNHQLGNGVWEQQRVNRRLRGLTAGIIGFGGVGAATADLLRAFDVRIMAINRSGRTNQDVDFAGTMNDLEYVLRTSDIVLLSVPLTNAMRGLIGATQLGWMKPDAMLINVGRGALADEDALFEHLVTVPTFQVGIDVWWEEPYTEGRFHTHHPILDLPNVVGSPHNSGHVPGMGLAGVERAAENVRRFLAAEPITGRVDRSEYE
jgi:phosphoglycerate dehydrogenase-like enzyme